MHSVPVVDLNNRPFMPTTPQRAKRWIKSGKATPFFRKGIFCVRLNTEPSARTFQPIALGIDPGSKREGFTVKSQAHTHLNLQFHKVYLRRNSSPAKNRAVTWVKDAEETSTNARASRRYRKTPCRPNRKNRSRASIPPSTKARWQLKTRVATFLAAIFPITHIGIEDIKAKTWKGAKQYNTSFSPLEVGKQWAYHELSKIAPVTTFDGFEDTYATRQKLGLKKSTNKLSTNFSTHCIDSWILAYLLVGGNSKPEYTRVIECVPIRLHRKGKKRVNNSSALLPRQLHVFNPGKNGYRRPYGGSMSQGFKRGSIVKHIKRGFCYVGGENVAKKQISLHSIQTGKRLTQSAKPTDLVFKSYSSWRINSPNRVSSQH